jgi:hypothetical protein
VAAVSAPASGDAATVDDAPATGDATARLRPARPDNPPASHATATPTATTTTNDPVSASRMRERRRRRSRRERATTPGRERGSGGHRLSRRATVG